MGIIGWFFVGTLAFCLAVGVAFQTWTERRHRGRISPKAKDAFTAWKTAFPEKMPEVKIFLRCVRDALNISDSDVCEIFPEEDFTKVFVQRFVGDDMEPVVFFCDLEEKFSVTFPNEFWDKPHSFAEIFAFSIRVGDAHGKRRIPSFSTGREDSLVLPVGR